MVKEKRFFNARTIILCSIFAALIAIGAYMKIPVPMVPFTLQSFFAIAAGLFLGGKKGAWSAAVYLIIGLIGIPVFTKGGGPAYVLQPTFGYIMGFVLGAYVTGKLAYRKKNPSVKTLFLASLIGLLTVYLVGVPYYYVVANFIISSPIGVKALLWYCFLATLPGDIVSCFLACLLAKRVVPIIKTNQ